MNKQPVKYSQHDPRWANWPYQTEGEHDTISKSGCGPSCAAMLIQTLTGKKFTPEDACWWAREHGYKAKGQGTYYSYFEPQFKAYGIDCHMLSWAKTYGKPDHENHKVVERMLREGWYAIALMKKGHWTPGGHFVVLWWQDDKVRINDPNSTAYDRENGDIRTFRSEVQYYWMVDAREYNNPKPKPIPKPTPKPKEDDNMTDKEFAQMFDNMRNDLRNNDCSGWSKEARDWAIKTGLTAGAPGPDGKPNYMWHDMLTREQYVTMDHKFMKLLSDAMDTAAAAFKKALNKEG